MLFALAIPVLLILTAFTAYALANLQHSTSSGWLGWLANTAENIALFGPRLAEHILNLDKWMTHALGKHFQAVEKKAVAWIVGLKQYAGWMAASAVAPAAAAWAFAWWMVHTEVPRLIHGRTKHIAQTAAHADATAQHAEGLARNTAKSHPGKVTPKDIAPLKTVALPHAQEWTWINEHWKALQRAVLQPVAIPGVLGLPVPLRWFGRTARQLRAHNRRLARLEKLIGVGAFALAMAKVLGITAKCLRSGNVNKVTKALCGLGPRALEDLLGLIADVLILQNICTVITLMEDGFKLIEPELTDFIVTAEKQFVHCKYDLPTIPAITLPYLPPVTGVVLNQAA